MSSVRRERSGAITDSVVLGENDPASFADLRYPVLVQGILREMMVVNLYLNTAFAKFTRNHLLTQ